MTYLLMFVLLFVVLLGCAFYIFPRRKFVDEMHGMMVGMGLGMFAGLITSALYLVPSGDFLNGTMLGSFVGLAFGVFFGRFGGHLGVMEGVMAGPMGGMMGAMLGQMVRPFNLEVFVPFFSFIVLISLCGLCYAVHCGVSCCGGAKKPSAVSEKFKVVWVFVSIVVLGVSVVLPFGLSDNVQRQTSSVQPELKLPSFLQFKEERVESVVKDGVQQVDMRIVNSAYSPNTLVVKKGIPLKINIKAEESAGCGSEIVIPDFKVRKIVGPGSSGVIELMPESVGEFKFSCSMDMARGKIVVV